MLRKLRETIGELVRLRAQLNEEAQQAAAAYAATLSGDALYAAQVACAQLNAIDSTLCTYSGEHNATLHWN